MREQRKFAERAKTLSSNEVRKKYFIVTEGEKTEQLYFAMIESHRETLGINPLIEFIPLVRNVSEDGWSNPQKIVDRLIQNLSESASGCISFENLINALIEYLFDENLLSPNVSQKSVWNTLSLNCIQLFNVSLSDTVTDVPSTCAALLASTSQPIALNVVVNDLPKIIGNQRITYSAGIDKICLIIDRDRNSFKSNPGNDQYAYVLAACKDNSFGFYLSNPCFEFWLLLHFSEVLSLDKNKLLSNQKVTSERRYVESELRKLFPGYTKSKYNAEALAPFVDNAIKNERAFCEDAALLESSLGSRVGLLIEEMRSR